MSDHSLIHIFVKVIDMNRGEDARKLLFTIFFCDYFLVIFLIERFSRFVYDLCVLCVMLRSPSLCKTSKETENDIYIYKYIYIYIYIYIYNYCKNNVM